MFDIENKPQEIVTSIKDIKFDPSIYPRIGEHTDEYPMDLAGQLVDGKELPPIKIDQNMRLLDGRNRLRAHELSGKPMINAVLVTVKDDAEAFRIACQENARHGQQFTSADRKFCVRKMYRDIAAKNPNNVVTADDMEAIVTALGICRSTAYRYVEDLNAAVKQERREAIESAITGNPKVSTEELAEKTGLSVKTAYRERKKIRQRMPLDLDTNAIRANMGATNLLSGDGSVESAKAEIIDAVEKEREVHGLSDAERRKQNKLIAKNVEEWVKILNWLMSNVVPALRMRKSEEASREIRDTLEVGLQLSKTFATKVSTTFFTEIDEITEGLQKTAGDVVSLNKFRDRQSVNGL